MAWSWPRWARCRWLVLFVLLGACSEGYSWSGARLSVDADGAQTVEFGLGRCMGENEYRLDVDQTVDEVRIGVDGDWSDHSDCAFGDVVPLDAPLGDREVRLTGPDHRYRACADSPGTGADAGPGSQVLCRDGEGTAEAAPITSRAPFGGLWVVEGTVPPIWLELTPVDGAGSFQLVGSAGCNEVIIDVAADLGGGWLAPTASITEAPCGEPAASVERGVLAVAGPVAVDEMQSRLTLGSRELRLVADGPGPEQQITWPLDADEAGRWEPGPLGASGELPTSAGCWWLSRWGDGAFVGEWILVDGEPFGAFDRHVAFEREQDAVAAGASCGATSDEPQHVGLPLGLARPGAYQACDGAFEGARCHRFAIVEPDLAPPPIRDVRAELAGVVLAYDGICLSGVPEQPGAAVIIYDQVGGGCAELTRPEDVTDAVVEVIRPGDAGATDAALVLGPGAAALLDELLAEHRAVALLVGDAIIGVVDEPRAAGAGTIVIDSFFDTQLGELERQLDD